MLRPRATFRLFPEPADFNSEVRIEVGVFVTAVLRVAAPMPTSRVAQGVIEAGSNPSSPAADSRARDVSRQRDHGGGAVLTLHADAHVQIRQDVQLHARNVSRRDTFGCDNPVAMTTRKMSKTDFETLADFRYALRRFLRFSEEVARKSGVTPLQYQLMLQIKGYPGREWANIDELAERLQAKHHGVVALISRCEEAGLVKRHPGRSDKRRVEVQLTKKGEECLEQLARLHRDELQSVKSGFTVPGAGRNA